MRLPRDFLGRAGAMTRDADAVAQIASRPRSLVGSDWVPHWTLAARRAELRAEDSTALEPRIRAIRQAAAYYSLAAYPVIEDDDRSWAYAQARRLYHQACRLEGAPAESIAVSFDGVTFPIALRRPPGAARGLVLVLRGLDSTKEVTYWDERPILAAGFAIVSADFPGMGENRCAMTTTTEQIYRAALDVALTQLGAGEVPVTAWGLGFGGYWAYRLAASDPRIVGAISIGGPVHHAFRPGLPRILRHLSEARFLQRIMRLALGPMQHSSVAAFVRQLSLVDTGTLSSLRTPLLYINGDRDVIVPLREGELIQRHAAAGAQRDVKIFEGTSHLASEVLESDVLPFCLSWVSAVHERARG
jgi:esterase FrsA